MKNIPSLKPQAGFTLIELLTVIAIVGVLAAIVTSGIGTARARARTSVSISNLRQIGIALNLYATDNKGTLPYTSGTDWISKTYPLIQGAPFPGFGLGDVFNEGRTLQNTVYWSPNLTDEEPKPWRSYGINGYMGFGTTLKMQNVSKPGKTILIGDCTSSSTLFATSTSFRNSGKMLVLKFDYSIQSLTQDQVSKSATDAQWKPY